MQQHGVPAGGGETLRLQLHPAPGTPGQSVPPQQLPAGRGRPQARQSPQGGAEDEPPPPATVAGPADSLRTTAQVVSTGASSSVPLG